MQESISNIGEKGSYCDGKLRLAEENRQFSSGILPVTHSPSCSHERKPLINQGGKKYSIPI
jgi:hypothetical protein